MSSLFYEKTNKQANIILLLLFIIFIGLSFGSCVQDSNDELFVEHEIILTEKQTILPSIVLKDENCSWKNFSFENKDQYIYVYEGKIFLTETAPDEFVTTLKIIYKMDNNISTEVTIKKPYIPITSLEIKIKNE